MPRWDTVLSLSLCKRQCNVGSLDFMAGPNSTTHHSPGASDRLTAPLLVPCHPIASATASYASPSYPDRQPSVGTVDGHNHLNPCDLHGIQDVVQGSGQEERHSTWPPGLHAQGGAVNGHAGHCHGIQSRTPSRRHARSTHMLQLRSRIRRGLLLVLLSLGWAALAARAPLIVNAYPSPGPAQQTVGGGGGSSGRPVSAARSSRLRTLLQGNAGISIGIDGNNNDNSNGSNSSGGNSSGSSGNSGAPLPSPKLALPSFTPPAPPALTGAFLRAHNGHHDQHWLHQ